MPSTRSGPKRSSSYKASTTRSRSSSSPMRSCKILSIIWRATALLAALPLPQQVRAVKMRVITALPRPAGLTPLAQPPASLLEQELPPGLQPGLEPPRQPAGAQAVPGAGHAPGKGPQTTKTTGSSHQRTTTGPSQARPSVTFGGEQMHCYDGEPELDRPEQPLQPEGGAIRSSRRRQRRGKLKRKMDAVYEAERPLFNQDQGVAAALSQETSARGLADPVHYLTGDGARRKLASKTPTADLVKVTRFTSGRRLLAKTRFASGIPAASPEEDITEPFISTLAADPGTEQRASAEDSGARDDGGCSVCGCRC